MQISDLKHLWGTDHDARNDDFMVDVTVKPNLKNDFFSEGYRKLKRTWEVWTVQYILLGLDMYSAAVTLDPAPPSVVFEKQLWTVYQLPYIKQRIIETVKFKSMVSRDAKYMCSSS